jgi:hypothetical protein
MHREPGMETPQFRRGMTVDAHQGGDPAERQTLADPFRKESCSKIFGRSAMRVVDALWLRPRDKNSAA